MFCDLFLTVSDLFLIVIYSYCQRVFNQILENKSLKIIRLQKSNTCKTLYFLFICPDPHIRRGVSPFNIKFWYTKLRLKLTIS